MSPEDVIEAFATTIIAGVLLAVTVYLLIPSVGRVLLDLVPAFVELMAYVLVVTVLLVVIYQFIEKA